MGVKSIKRLLADKGIEGVPVDTLLYPKHIHIDVMLLHHSFLTTTKQAAKKTEFLKVLKDSTEKEDKVLEEDPENGDDSAIDTHSKMHNGLARILVA